MKKLIFIILGLVIGTIVLFNFSIVDSGTKTCLFHRVSKMSHRAWVCIEFPELRNTRWSFYD